MEKLHIAVLRNCRVQLVKDLITPDLLDVLERNELFSKEMISDIEAEKTITRQARKLLDDVTRRGPRAFGLFVNGLRETAQEHLSNLILNEETRLRNLPPGSSWSAISTPDIGPATAATHDPGPISQPTGVTERGEPLTQTYSLSVQEEATPGDESGQQLTSSPMETATDTNVQTMSTYARLSENDRYRMESTPRGYVFIINNINFANPEWDRAGASTDGEQLVTLFRDLGFYIDYREDLNAQDMKTLIQRFAKLQKHADLDSCVLAILSHGDSNEIIYGTDGGMVNFKDIYGYFSSTNCPHLLGKPKLFILQACRGQNSMGNSTESSANCKSDVMPMGAGSPTSTENSPQPSLSCDALTLPPNSDMILAYSTTEGDPAYRNTVHGSWYIEAFADVFRQHHRQTEVAHLLIKVNNVVANRQGTSGLNCQIPSPVVMTRKQWYLNAP